MSKKILLVEDSPTQAKRTQMILSNEGYETKWVTNGREGLDSITNEQPDMVITDIEMPVMNGYRFCKNLKNDSLTTKIPVVMLTSRSDSLDIIKGLEAGADNFITKPFEQYYLIKQVRKIFDNFAAAGKGGTAEAEIIHGYQGQIALTTERQQILELLFNTINSSVECDAMGLLLISNGDSHLFFQVSHQPLSKETSFSFKKRILSAAILLCKHETTVKLRTQEIVNETSHHEIDKEPGSFANVPLINNSQTIGMLAITNLKPDMYDADDIKFLFQLGAESAQAFDRIMR